jgi:hypothetical protein
MSQKERTFETQGESDNEQVDEAVSKDASQEQDGATWLERVTERVSRVLNRHPRLRAVLPTSDAGIFTAFLLLTLILDALYNLLGIVDSRRIKVGLVVGCVFCVGTIALGAYLYLRTTDNKNLPIP